MESIPISEEEFANALDAPPTDEISDEPIVISEEEFEVASEVPVSADKDSGDPAGVSGEPEMSGLDQFLSGLGQGVKETLVASSVTKEEAQAPRTLTEIAGEMVGGMGIDMAAAYASTQAGALAGSFVPVIGTAVGGLVGLVGYGIYAGISQENLAEKRSGEFSNARAGLRVALSVNPLLRYGGKVSQMMTRVAPKIGKAMKATEKVGTRVARVAGQVAGEATVAGSEFGKDQAMMAAGVSILLHGYAFKSGMEITPATSRVIGEASASDSGVEAGVKATKRLNALSPEEAKFTPDKLDEDFARTINRTGHLTAGGAKSKAKGLAAAKEQLKHMGEEEVDGFYQDHLLSKFMGEELAQITDDLTGEFTKRGSLKQQLQSTEEYHSKWTDGLAAASEFDRTAGTGAVEVLNGISEARGMYERLSPAVLKLGIKAQKLTKKAGISKKEMGQLRAFLSEGKPDKWRKGIDHLLDSEDRVGGKVKVAVDAWSDAFDSGYELIKTQGFRPNYQDTYMPRQMMSMNEKVSRIEDYTTNVLKMVGKIEKPNLRRWKVEDLTKAGLSEPAAQNMVEQIKDLGRISKHLGGTKALTITDLGSLKKRALSSKNSYRMGNDVSAVFSKGKDFSDNFREFDISKAFLGYVNGSVKSAVMSKAMRKAYGQHEAFALAGMPETAKWWGNLLQDLSGDVRGDIRSTMLDKSNAIKYAIYKGVNKESKSWTEAVGWNTANATTKLMSGWQTAMYPAYLGLNAKATIRNLAQNWVQTAPWMGGSYGYQTVAKASTSNFFKHMKRLKKDGVIAQGVRAEALKDTSTVAGRAMGRIGDMVMKLYTASDTMNRLIAYNAGHVMAKDLANSSNDAIRALEKMGPGVRASLKKANLTSVESFGQNLDQLGDILGKHTVAKTQFHYGPEQKAEFLREMGPMFSMFTKWPVSIGSDLNTIWRENPKAMAKSKRYFERYGASLGAAIYLRGVVGDNNHAYNALVGDITTWAPIMSTVDMSILNNPLIETLLATPEAMKEILVDQDPKKVEARMKAALRKLGKSSIPGASSMLNEADRWRKAKKKKTVSQEMIDNLFD